MRKIKDARNVNSINAHSVLVFYSNIDPELSNNDCSVLNENTHISYLWDLKTYAKCLKN